MNTIDNNLDTQIVDFLDLVNETLNRKFISKWRFRFSETFLKNFQLKLLNALNKGKPLKIKTLFNYLTKKCGYSQEQVINFMESIDIDIYYPLVQGKLSNMMKDL